MQVLPEQQTLINFLSESYKVICIVVLVLLFSNATISAQELEPRSLTNVPIGTQFVGLGYGYGQGSILLDPSLPIEGLNAKMNSVLVAYVQSFNFFGMSAKFDAMVPWAHGYWDGLYNAEDTSTSRMGMGDPRFRVSVNFIGAPALNGNEYSKYNQKTIVGASLQVIDPLGQYYSDKLLNLGSNRWTFRPQLGLSQKLNKWYLEAYMGLWIFTPNNRFYGGSRLTQKPIYTTKIHIIRSFPKRIWAALDMGYGIGGQASVNGELKDTRQSNFRYGATLAVPVYKSHTLKLAFYSGTRMEKGHEISALVLVYQYTWQKKEAKPQVIDPYQYKSGFGIGS